MSNFSGGYVLGQDEHERIIWEADAANGRLWTDNNGSGGSGEAAAAANNNMSMIRVAGDEDDDAGRSFSPPKRTDFSHLYFLGMEIDSSEESSPIGLQLRKTESLVNLLETKLLESSSSSSSNKSNNNIMDSNCDNNIMKPPPPPPAPNDYGSQPMSEKLKASNFPAMLLRIGNWEKISRHEGDLVAKCYYAKKKLVWEILEGPLKSKIEIQWNDIIGIRASMVEDQPGILDIELNQPPSFFRETNPQPRKHTLWQPANDFTGGQAPNHRLHHVRFAPGVLDKHYEKLLQCHPNLLSISQRSFPSQPGLYFEKNTRINLSSPEFVLDGFGLPGLDWRQTQQPLFSNSQLSVMDRYPLASLVNDKLMNNTATTNHDFQHRFVERPPMQAMNLQSLGFPNEVTHLPPSGRVGVGRRIPTSHGFPDYLQGITTMTTVANIENHLLSDNYLVPQHISSMNPSPMMQDISISTLHGDGGTNNNVVYEVGSWDFDQNLTPLQSVPIYGSMSMMSSSYYEYPPHLHSTMNNNFGM